MKRSILYLACLTSLAGCGGGTDASTQPPVEMKPGLYSIKAMLPESFNLCLGTNDAEATVQKIIQTAFNDNKESGTMDCTFQDFKRTGNAIQGVAICTAETTEVIYNFTGDLSTEGANTDGTIKHIVTVDEDGAPSDEEMVGMENVPVKITAAWQGECP